MLNKKNYSVKGKNVLGGKEQKEIRERCIGLYHLRDDVPHSDATTTGNDSDDLAGGGSSSCGNSDLIQQAFFPKKARVMQVRWQYSSSPHCYALITTVNDVPYCVELFSLPDLDATSFGGTAVRKPIVSAFFPTVLGFLRLRQLTAHVGAAPALKMACQSFIFGTSRQQSTGEDELSPGDQVDLAWSHRIASAVVWCHGATSAHVVRGAHLMVPGICSVTVRRQEGNPATSAQSPLPAPGSLVFVCTNNNPVPFAVGLLSHELHAALRKQPISGGCGLNWFLVDRARGHGPGVLVLHSIGDFLWQEWWSVYHSACTKEKVSPLTAVIPTTHASVALGNSTEVDEGEMPDLLKGLLLAAAAAAAPLSSSVGEEDVKVQDAVLSHVIAAVDPSAEQSQEPATAVAEGDQEAPQETNEEEAAQRIEEEEDEEQDVLEEEEDWWLLFPTIESVLTFAACETVKALKPSKFPVPCTLVISQLNKLYPRGLPSTAETGGSVDAQRLELVKGQIDWKKTPFKKALVFLTAVMAKDGTMTLKETSPGVHAVTSVNKMSDLMRNHRRVFTNFLQLIHRPQFDAELDAEQQQHQSQIAATSSGSSSTPLQILQSLEVVYRPQSGLHPQLFQLLCRGRWITDGGVTAGGEDDQEDEDDDLYDGLVRDRKTLRDRVRAYLKEEGLMVLPSAPGMLPHAVVNPLLRHLWPANCNTVPETIPLNELDETVVRKFCPMHVLTYGDGRRRLHNGPPPTVKIHVERRCGNKHVTLVRNLGPFGFRLEQLAGEWRHALATSVNITEATVGVKTKHLGAAGGGAPSAAKRGDANKEVQVLGSLASRVEQLLVDKFGVPRSLIVVTSK